MPCKNLAKKPLHPEEFASVMLFRLLVFVVVVHVWLKEQFCCSYSKGVLFCILKSNMCLFIDLFFSSP